MQLRADAPPRWRCADEALRVPGGDGKVGSGGGGSRCGARGGTAGCGAAGAGAAAPAGGAALAAGAAAGAGAGAAGGAPPTCRWLRSVTSSELRLSRRRCRCTASFDDDASEKAIPFISNNNSNQISITLIPTTLHMLVGLGCVLELFLLVPMFRPRWGRGGSFSSVRPQ